MNRRSNLAVAVAGLLCLATACADNGDTSMSNSSTGVTTASTDASTADSGTADSGTGPIGSAENDSIDTDSSTTGDTGSSTPTTTGITTPTPETTEADAATTTDRPVYDVVTIDGELVDEARDRHIPYRVYAPAGLDGDVPVILVSHGGEGHPLGYLSAPHLGTTYAADGYLAIHIGHLVSNPGARPIEDRPADVTFVLDALEAGDIVLPDGFTGSPDLTRVGIAGHSFGAYTAHAVAGADYGRSFRDERIDAIAALSPQGPDQFGAFDRGPDDNTWETVTIPAYDLIGSVEMDSNAVDSIVRPGWRMVPFERYPTIGDKFVTVLGGQDHSDLWRTGKGDVPQFIAEETAKFFDVYVKGDESVDACTIGVRPDLDVDAATQTKPAVDDSHIDDCG